MVFVAGSRACGLFRETEDSSQRIFSVSVDRQAEAHVAFYLRKGHVKVACAGSPHHGMLQRFSSAVGADSRASFTLALSSFFCTLLTSPSSTSAGTVRAYCASDWSHCATARRSRPVFS